MDSFIRFRRCLTRAHLSCGQLPYPPLRSYELDGSGVVTDRREKGLKSLLSPAPKSRMLSRTNSAHTHHGRTSISMKKKGHDEDDADHDEYGGVLAESACSLKSGIAHVLFDCSDQVYRITLEVLNCRVIFSFFVRPNTFSSSQGTRYR